MAWGLSDPYCRFISPEELSAMKKYDVTGVGLNLGTGVEYTRKTVGAACASVPVHIVLSALLSFSRLPLSRCATTP